MDNLIEIIKKIQARKQGQNKFPAYALKNEIWIELFHQMEIELELLWHDGKISSGESVNHQYFEIRE
jgi:hypothetical protein